MVLSHVAPTKALETEAIVYGGASACGEGALRRDAGRCAVLTKGVISVHSCPPAVCPHVEWAIGRVLGTSVKLGWEPQAAEPGMMRAERTWRDGPGMAAELAAALRQWPMLRFEVTEQPSDGVDGERIMHVPDLGVFRGAMSASGDLMVNEDRIRALVATTTSSEGLRNGLDKLLGTEWDRALETYRFSSGETEQTWLWQVSLCKSRHPVAPPDNRGSVPMTEPSLARFNRR